MSKPQDAGLKYVRELSMQTFHSSSSAYDHIASKIGKLKTAELVTWFDRRTKTDLAKENDFYTFKNSDLTTSMLASEAFDTDYIRRMCNWIEENRELFGETILEVGCDCGILTCYLAKTFPEAQVVGIDRNENAVLRARELAEKLNVTNVSFQQANVYDYREQYDTVLATRITQENIAEPEHTRYDTFYHIARDYKDALRSLIRSLTKLIKPEGCLINGIMVGIDPYLYATLSLLSETECYPVNSEILQYSQFKESIRMQMIISFNDKEFCDDKIMEIYQDSINSEDWKNELLKPYLISPQEFWSKLMFNVRVRETMKMGEASYTGWEANIMLDDTADKLIEGYFIYPKNSNTPFIGSLWTNINDDTALVVFANANDSIALQSWFNMDMSQKEEQISLLHESLKRSVESGNVARIAKLDYIDGEFVETDVPLSEIVGHEIKEKPKMQKSDFADLLRPH